MTKAASLKSNVLEARAKLEASCASNWSRLQMPRSEVICIKGRSRTALVANLQAALLKFCGPNCPAFCKHASEAVCESSWSWAKSFPEDHARFESSCGRSCGALLRHSPHVDNISVPLQAWRFLEAQARLAISWHCASLKVPGALCEVKVDSGSRKCSLDL